MKAIAAEAYRDIDFSRAKRGPIVAPDPGKTKISIRLDNAVLEHFRTLVERAGGGNYQSLINDALLAHIRQGSMLEVMRQVLKEELFTGTGRRVATGRTSSNARKRAVR